MLDAKTRRAVVQHAMNIISFIQQIEEEVQTILELLEIEKESVPFEDENFDSLKS
uniref:Uncharacterized protein n=1 Tax=Candidatus Kentrum sp. TUN TaxID=2126343 RepID=A0A450ZP26_9GAMM|nr:MAG: hypothetical protein BECKTUN1418F_GA0071002_10712 [Candidatus Kentron sp. TUN]VFK61732.1 MAG: hypothetical protein BECKTUN1418E_GA0071001_10712 [Candidatus Kentron sp. TUN]